MEGGGGGQQERRAWKGKEFQYYSDKILAAASHANEVGLEEDEICWIRLTKVFFSR